MKLVKVPEFAHLPWVAVRDADWRARARYKCGDIVQNKRGDTGRIIRRYQYPSASGWLVCYTLQWPDGGTCSPFLDNELMLCST